MSQWMAEKWILVPLSSRPKEIPRPKFISHNANIFHKATVTSIEPYYDQGFKSQREKTTIAISKKVASIPTKYP